MINIDQDILGKTFGKLTAISKASPRIDKHGKNHCQILCSCECGNEVTVDLRNLVSGNSKTCGKCNRSERLKKHGMHGTRIYNIWKGIKNRCYNQNHHTYSIYGGRGIQMCTEWKDSFDSFYKWAMKNNYQDDLSIDRIDVNGDYTPENCRWCTKLEQGANKRNNIMINGICLSKYCRENNLNYDTIRRRIKYYGFTPEEAVTKPIRSPINKQT